MTDEMFYFYHISHMVKHFAIGGCGIRTLVDLWILDHMEDAEKMRRDALLEKCGLVQFTEAARKLSRCWIEKTDHDSLTQQMEEYIINGGVFGAVQNRVVFQQQKRADD